MTPVGLEVSILALNSPLSNVASRQRSDLRYGPQGKSAACAAARGRHAAPCHASLDGHTPLTFADKSSPMPADLNHLRWVAYCRELVQLPGAA